MVGSASYSPRMPEDRLSRTEFGDERRGVVGISLIVKP
jgi:hypothetical protein